MSFGTVYTRAGNPRTIAIRAVAVENNLDIDYQNVGPAKGVGQEYLALNPLGKVPTLVRSDGFVLTECIAINLYLAQQNPKTSLLGSTPEQYATIVRWMSFVNNDVYDVLGGWFLPLIGRRPYNKESVLEHMDLTEKRLRMIENQLCKTRYLTGDELTLADLFVCGILASGFQCFFGEEWRESHPEFTRWCRDVYHQEIYQKALAPEKRGKLVEIKIAMPNEPFEDPTKIAR
ncbi:translation elongation factor-like protein [Dothistroma septosporum NZE10]|uniref:Translation elongation factor-like protein n=1 Tax=Dothistroma septosporum (strain NZE10 / CBS 128990) TaxID=675120 RepID=M2XI00_DOTSN|nr:translation elongation factor-like protein [Dothistroma septosporum NZE10]